MNQKNLVIIIIVSLIGIAVVGYQFYKYFLPNSIGAIYNPPSAAEVTQGNAINNLQSALPLIINDFSINDFDYSKGLFVVDFNSPVASSEAKFNAWLQSSSYSAVPRDMFEIILPTSPVVD